MPLVRDKGVVLRTYRLGEADRIVVLMTAERGAVRAVAKGVRRTRSRFGARLEPTAHVAVQLWEGRELDVVTQAETVERFSTLRSDLDRLTRATVMLEAVDHLSRDRGPDPDLYRMLVGALRELDRRGAPALVGAFLLKLLRHEGIEPVLDVCVRCGSDGPFVAFDPAEGGVLCRSCRVGRAMSTDALDLARGVLGGRLSEVLDQPAGPAVAELEALATDALEHHIERRLRSTGVLGR